MKAMVFEHYGPPEELHLQEVATPTPRDNEVQLRVCAASVNALDWHFLRGSPILVRLQYGLFTPKRKILGYDVAGIVECVGAQVQKFQPGDAVFGGLGWGLGGFAEYVCIREDGLLVHKPEQVSFEQAASVVGAGVAALKGLRDKGKLKPGQRVLINGASGGVGTFAVQIAKALGALVTGVCSTHNLEMVRALGADQVIDYTKQDFAESDQRYDLILDVVGNRPIGQLMRSLTKTGTAVVLGFSSMALQMQHSLWGPMLSKKDGKQFVPASAEEPTQADLLTLCGMLESGKLKPAIDRIYSLEDLPKAIRYVELKHARAKVVISMNELDAMAGGRVTALTEGPRAG